MNGRMMTYFRYHIVRKKYSLSVVSLLALYSGGDASIVSEAQKGDITTPLMECRNLIIMKTF